MMRAIFSLFLLLLGHTTAGAAVLTASFTQLSGPSWAIDLKLTNDGEPAEIKGFTVYFSEAVFSNLSVAASPAGWDSIVIQPDLALASPGFFDSLLIDPGSALVLGQTQTGFRAEFMLVGESEPPMLPFEIVDENFNVLFSGFTTPIPEPTTLILWLSGAAVLLTSVCGRNGRLDVPGPL